MRPNRGKNSVNHNRLRLIRSRLPKLNNTTLIEIFGMLVGDGWLGITGKKRIRKQVCFCGNLKTEKNYCNYVRNKIKSTLNVNGYYKERIEENTYYIIINSESIFDLFREFFDFPVGIKNYFNVNKFPKAWSKQKVFIRGIFDTDGSTFFDKDNRYRVPYPILDITLTNPEVLDWVTDILRKHNFTVIRGAKYIRLKGSKNFHKWFKDISPKNQVHKEKYSKWILEYSSMGS